MSILRNTFITSLSYLVIIILYNTLKSIICEDTLAGKKAKEYNLHCKIAQEGRNRWQVHVQ